MRSIKILGKQVAVLFIFSILVSIAAIMHGLFFDLQFSEIKRLTIGGLIFTLVVIFPSILFLEWVFDLNNKKKDEELERRIIKLEKFMNKK